MLHFVLLLVHFWLWFLQFTTIALACRPPTLGLRLKLEQNLCYFFCKIVCSCCATSCPKLCDPFCATYETKCCAPCCATSGARCCTPSCAILLVQNLALSLRLKTRSRAKTFEVRQFLCPDFHLGQPWLCWGGSGDGWGAGGVGWLVGGVGGGVVWVGGGG